MTRAPASSTIADSAAPQSPFRAAERGAASPPPSPAPFPQFGQAFNDAFAGRVIETMVDADAIAEKLAPVFLAEMPDWPGQRGMPVAQLTPVQRLAKGLPGIPGQDSYAPRPDDAPLSPYTHLGIPRRDRIWMVQFLALAGAVWFVAERLGWLS
jgi:hypothetical protein